MAYSALADQHQHIHHIGAGQIPVSNERVSQHILKVVCDVKENLLFWLHFTVSAAIRCFSLVRRNRIRLIVNFSPFYTLLCFLPILFYRIPATTFIRADNQKHGQNAMRNLFFYFADWIGILLSDHILLVSEHLKAVYRKRYRIPARKLIVLSNHIEQNYRIAQDEKQRWRHRLDVDEQTFLVSSAGAVQPGKNFIYLIEAFAHVDNPAIRLVILGDEITASGEMSRLKQTADRMGVTDRICFYGWARDPLPLIASMDLFVLPSKYEGSPNILLEALSCGIPCLGSDIAEVREILEFDELLFPLDNHRILGERMARACNAPGYYDTLRRLSQMQCRKYRFDWQRAFLHTVIDRYRQP